MKKEFHERMKELRLKRGYTQLELGNLIGKPPQSISRIESGRISTVRNTTAEKLAQALRVTVDYIIHGEGQEIVEYPEDVMKFLNDEKNFQDVIVFVRETMLERARRGEIE